MASSFYFVMLLAFNLVLHPVVFGRTIHLEAVPKSVDRASSRSSSIDNDFESGSAGSWFDESPGYVNWRVEDYTRPTETSSPAPRPLNGTKILRATRNATYPQSGLAILRSVSFTANPGDQVSFDYWIRSKRPEGNNLELAWLVGRNETLLVGLSQYSTLANYEWRTEIVTIPADYSTQGTLYFYGYCGGYNEDAIAIDNVRVLPSAAQTTTPPSETGGCKVLSSEEGTLASPNYPEYYPNNAYKCWIITGVNSYSLTLQVISFETERIYDSLKFYRGYNETKYELQTFTGYYPAGYTMVLEGEYSYTVVFTSDSSNTAKGFRMYYTTASPDYSTYPYDTTYYPWGTTPWLNQE